MLHLRRASEWRRERSFGTPQPVPPALERLTALRQTSCDGGVRLASLWARTRSGFASRHSRRYSARDF